MENKGDVPYILKAIDEKVVELGVAGRIATWTAPVTMNLHPCRGRIRHGLRQRQVRDKKDIQRAKFTLEKAAGAVRIRAFDEEKAPNFLMVVGESIIFGKK